MNHLLKIVQDLAFILMTVAGVTVFFKKNQIAGWIETNLHVKF